MPAIRATAYDDDSTVLFIADLGNFSLTRKELREVQLEINTAMAQHDNATPNHDERNKSPHAEAAITCGDFLDKDGHVARGPSP